MTEVRATEDGTVRDDPPAANDFGLVVRPVGPIGPIIQSDARPVNGTETPVTAAVAVRVLAANPIPNGTIGSRVIAIIQNKGTANICVGAADVTAATGLRLIPNAIAFYGVPDNFPGEFWAIGETADSIVFAQETVRI